MEKIALRVKGWIQKNPKEFIFVLLIILLAAFLRLYRISEYMTFLGDEGRDVILVRRLLVNFDPILIGPGTSIGNMYLGPLYYYMMAPALFLAGYSPVGPAVQIALLGVITVGFVWYVARQWFGKAAALVASLLYAISPVVVNYSRSSWNPNIMPFFALLCIYSTWQFWQKDKFGWIIVAGVSFAFVLQSHYLGLLLAPIMGLYWTAKLINIRGDKNQMQIFIKLSLISAAAFAFLMSPLVIFDARHDWRNFEAMKKFFTERQTTVSAKPWSAIPALAPLSEKVSGRLLGGTDKTFGKWIALGIAGFWAWLFILKNKIKKLESVAYMMIFVWLATALIGLGVYKQEIYDHYYGFFFAAPFLFVGGASQKLIQEYKKVGIFLVILLVIALSYLSFKATPIRYPPNGQLSRTIEVSQKIKDESQGKKFNLAVIAERNYEDAYQYFLESWEAGVTEIDSQRLEQTVGQYLFVVCELPEEKCDPTRSPKAEVANFGWSKIEEKWEVGGVILYKLAHAI